MKPKLTYLLALTFLFLFSGSVYGQEEVKKEYWDNGKLRTEFHYKNKSPTVWTWYYKTGLKKSTKHFKNGIENGLRTEWDADGKITDERNFVEGKEE